MIFRNICIEASCNLNCSYCGGSKVKIDEDDIIEKLHTIFDRFDKGTTCFRVECFGEITLYKHLMSFLHNSCKLGYIIEILTNGTFMSESSIQCSPMQWVVSLDGHTEQMNKARRLTQKQIDNILELVVQNHLEIQCVFYDQSIDEINQFISYLDHRHYNGFLHIFPYRNPKDIEPLKRIIYYDELYKTKFLPPQDYFQRWDYIVKNRKRNFDCDFLKNGYVYRIDSQSIKMIKCDCNTFAFRYEHDFGDERQYKVFPCGTCLSHYEYNNQRNFVFKEVKCP